MERQIPMEVRADRRQINQEEIKDAEIKDAEALLELIENEELYQALKKLDDVGQKILVLKMQEYTTEEIAEELGITKKAVYRRMDRIKEKIKKIVE